MNHVGWAVVGALLVGLAGAVVGCSEDAPSAEAIAEAEELALAALLTEGDLPDLLWEVEDSGIEEMRESLAMAAERSETMPPDECRNADEPPDVTRVFEDVLAIHLRGFVRGDLPSGAERAGLNVTVVVLKSAEQVQELTGGEGAQAVSDECLEALAARSEQAGYEVRDDAPLYGLADEISSQRRTLIVTSRGETSEMVTETHMFARGRIIAIYSAVGSDRRSLDHQALLEAFEARVVGAQEE